MLNNLVGGLIGKVVDNAEGILDKVITTDKEREEAKAKIKQMLLDSEAKMQEEVTARWKSDMQSDSWLSKSIRPLVLAWLVICTTLLIFIDAGVIMFTVEDKWVDLLQLVLITVIGAYFGGRSYEKIKK
ncbi:3TM-type holin [bacterium]|jgi:cation transport ATPase|nr:3TM-type holin [bacterium]